MEATLILANFEAKKSLAAKAAAAAKAKEQAEFAQQRHEAERPGKVLKIAPERLVRVPPPDKFDDKHVWAIFNELTLDWEMKDREATWFDIVDRIVPPGHIRRPDDETVYRKIFADFTGQKDVLATPTLNI